MILFEIKNQLNPAAEPLDLARSGLDRVAGVDDQTAAPDNVLVIEYGMIGQDQHGVVFFQIVQGGLGRFDLPSVEHEVRHVRIEIIDAADQWLDDLVNADRR